MRLHLLKIFTRNVLIHFPCDVKSAKYTYNKNAIINHNISLNDRHIDYFNELFKQCSIYESQTLIFLQNLNRVKEISSKKKHIQVLFQKPLCEGQIGHWLCAYYDVECIYVYDSLNCGYLNKDNEKFLRKFVTVQP